MTNEAEQGDWSDEAAWWARVEGLRLGRDVSEHRRIVMGLLSLKFYADMFQVRYSDLADAHKNPEDPGEYLNAQFLWFDSTARWSYLQSQTSNPEIGIQLGRAVQIVQGSNPRFHGLGVGLAQTLAAQDSTWLGVLIDFLSTIKLQSSERFQRLERYFLEQFDVLFRLYGYAPKCSVQRDLLEENALASEMMERLDLERVFLDRLYDAWTTEPSYLRYRAEDGARPYDPPNSGWKIAVVGTRQRWWFEITDTRPRHSGMAQGRPYQVDPIGSHIFLLAVGFVVRTTSVTDRTSLVRIAAERILSAMLDGRFGQEAAQFQYSRNPDHLPMVVYLDKD